MACGVLSSIPGPDSSLEYTDCRPSCNVTKCNVNHQAIMHCSGMR